MATPTPLCELLDRWRTGDQAAADEIYCRFQQRLLHWAAGKIDLKFSGRISEESICVTTLNYLLQGVREGRYSFDGSSACWHFVLRVAGNKIRNRAEHEQAGCRDVNRVQPGGPETTEWPPAVVKATPEDSAVLADEVANFRSRLKPDLLRIFDLMWEGASYAEIAKELGCSVQAVRIKVKRLLELLRRWAEGTE